MFNMFQMTARCGGLAPSSQWNFGTSYPTSTFCCRQLTLHRAVPVRECIMSSVCRSCSPVCWRWPLSGTAADTLNWWLAPASSEMMTSPSPWLSHLSASCLQRCHLRSFTAANGRFACEFRQYLSFWIRYNKGCSFREGSQILWSPSLILNSADCCWDTGTDNESAVIFLRELGRRMSTFHAYLFQKLSVTVQRYSAVILHDNFFYQVLTSGHKWNSFKSLSRSLIPRVLTSF